MQLFLFLVAVLPSLALSKSTINKRSLFENTLKRWNVEIRDRRDLSERWKRFVEAKRNVDETTSGVMLESLNRFAVNNKEEHADLMARAKRSANLTMTMLNAMSEEAEEKRFVKRDASHEDPADLTVMPPSFNYWEEVVGLTTPKNQKSCGSCWSFPTTGALEALYRKLTGEKVSFAEQYFVDCAFSFSGCAGGAVNDGFKLLKKTQFLPLEDDYPYTANYNAAVGCPQHVKEDRAAGTNNGMKKMVLQEWYPLSHDEAGFLSGLRYSPVAFGAYVGDRIMDYAGGDWEDTSCVTNPSPHAQLLVGYTEKTIRIRGSYGEKWGEGGYGNFLRNGFLASCNYFKNAYFILATQRKEEEYAFCRDAKLATRDECQASCHSMNTAGETGWDLAVIPTQMHNQQVMEMVNAKIPGYKGEDKFKLLWIGLNDPEKHDHYHWSDHCTPVNYVNFTRSMTPAKFGLFDKNSGKWTMKNSKTFKARGLCSRAATCWDISNAVLNGKVTFDTSGRLVEGSTAKVACGAGCTLEGEDILRCAGGVWNNNDPLPRCVGSCTDHDHDKDGGQDHDAEDHEDHDHNKDGTQDHDAADHDSDHDHDNDGTQDHDAADHPDHDHDNDGTQDHDAADHKDKGKKKKKDKKKKGKKGGKSKNRN